MLTIYRRHTKDCQHKAEGRAYRRCKCPVWADGFLGRTEVRKSLGTSDWNKALEIINHWQTEKAVLPETDNGPITIIWATSEFEADAIARGLQERTVYKYKILFRQLKAFAGARGVAYLKQLDAPTVRQFRASWKDQNLAALKKLERLRQFFRFAASNSWLESNPTTDLKNPKVTMRPTLPFTSEEVLKILGAVESYKADPQGLAAVNGVRFRALILMLRYSGLRIGDAVRCERSSLVDGKLRIYTQKTGTHVYIPLPEFVVKELQRVPPMSDAYWFWSGNGKLATQVADWQGRLQRLEDFTDVPNIHAHRFRDTFAVELLLASVPIERVAVLLGHSSIKVTEKHYAPWIRARQEQAEADVRRTWSTDQIFLIEKQMEKVSRLADAPAN
jgi:integrase/recombinase XerD